MNVTAIDFRQTPRPKLEAEILYEDFATGLRAHYLLHGVRRRLDADLPANESLWRFDVLLRPELLRQAVDDGLRADLVIISAHGDGRLPEPLKTWAADWLVAKGENAPDLILALDPHHRDHSDTVPFLAELRTLVRQANVEVLACFLEPPIVRREGAWKQPADWELPSRSVA